MAEFRLPQVGLTCQMLRLFGYSRNNLLTPVLHKVYSDN
jgi:hypothetical protein